MCDYRILFQENYGYAAQCNGCNHIEVAFGTSLFRFHVDHLDCLINYLDRVKRHSAGAESARKNVLLDLAALETLQVILTYQELIQLCKMVDRIQSGLAADALLNLFRTSGN
jgi:hypothetical protein